MSLFSLSLAAPASSNGVNYRAEPEFTANYGLGIINADVAYQRGYFGQNVTVAVVDSGMSVQHAELSANIVPGFNFIENNTGITDPIGGPDKPGGHGTHVAGIIAAIRESGVGMHGVAPFAKIMPMQHNNDGSTKFTNTFAGVSLAASRNVQIINNSYSNAGGDILGTYKGKTVVLIAPKLAPSLLNNGVITDGIYQRQMNEYANVLDSRDVVMVWAAGNEGFNSETGSVRFFEEGAPITPVDTATFVKNFVSDTGFSLDSANQAGGDTLMPLYESNLRGKWVAVVATDENNRIAHFSNACGLARYWCLAAPGTNIYSTTNKGNGYDSVNGTSFSAPHVSGALAVLKSRFPDMPMHAVLALLLATATDRGEEGVDEVYGHGLLNLGAAVTMQGAMSLPVPTEISEIPPYRPISVIGAGNTQAALYYNSADSRSLFSLSLAAPAPSNGIDYRAESEFVANYGLDAINADIAYQRGYFGQNVTVAVVDTGVSVQHAELSANIVPGYNFFDDNAVISDSVGHGTHVAGIIAATRKKGSRGVQGVAPLAKIMPMQHAGKIDRHTKNSLGVSLAAFRNVQIINNSYGRQIPIAGKYEGKSIAFYAPKIAPMLVSNGVITDSAYQSEMNYFANALDSRDVVMVWAMGNTRLNSEAGVVEYYERVRLTNTVTRVIRRVFRNTMHVDAPTFVKGFVSDTGYSLTSANQASGDALMPLYEDSLRGKWVAVVATGINNKIASYSNGCGLAKYWCLAAPGTGIYSTANDDSEYNIKSGTSFSAPHVSGALAVLKSRFPDMPMHAVLALLLATATDSGEEGVDEVYGHGLLNLGAAVTAQGGIAVPVPGAVVGANDVSSASANRLLTQSNIRLPSALAGLRSQLAGASLAVSYLNGQYYYDMPLANLVSSPVSTLSPVLGQAAAHLLRDDTLYGDDDGFSALINADGLIRQASWENRRIRLLWDVCGGCALSAWQQYETAATRPFFTDSRQGWDATWKISGDWEVFAAAGVDKQADDNKYRQWGLRWHKEGLRGWDLSSAFSRIDEKETFMGGEYNGVFAVSGARTYQSALHGKRRLSKQWSVESGVVYGWSDIKARANSLIQGSSGVRFHGWRVGVEGRAVWRGDDTMRFALRRLPSIHTGDMHLRYGVSAAPTLVKNFQLDLPTSYDMVNNDFALRGDNALLLQWGYAFSPQEGMEVAFALEHLHSERYRDNSALSLSFIWKL